MRDGTEARHWGTYLELDRPTRIVFTWIVEESEEANPSKVRLSNFTPQADGCVATITHENGQARGSTLFAQTESGWARMLEQVDNILSEGFVDA